MKKYKNLVIGGIETKVLNLILLGAALRSGALGLEALNRTVRHEPLYRIHECVLGVLALESERVDPRL